MLRKVLLLVCIAITVFCYGWPFFAVPFGKYEGKIGDENVTYEFSFNGSVIRKVGEETKNGKYELDFPNKSIKVTLEGEETASYALKNMYEFGGFKNQIGEFTMLGVGILAVVVVLLSPTGNND